MASTSVGSIHYDLKLNTSAFDRAVTNVSSKAKSVGTKMVSMGKTMTMGVTLPVIAGFGFAVKAASDLNETLNKVDVAFKDQSDEVKKWAKTSIESMGLAQQSALDATALFGDMSTAMGLSTKEAATMSMGLTQLGADMASFKNISFERAQVALAGVYTGETEALKGLGIVMTEANLEAFAQSKGIKKNIKDMTQAEKVQLRYAYVMKVTKNAQGDFTRTAGGTANQIRITQERFKELSANVGNMLLPIANRLLKVIQGWLDKFSKLSPETQKFILMAVAIVAALGPVLIIMGSLVKAIGTIGTAIKFLAMSPHMLVITAALLVLAGLAYVIIRNWGTLKRWFATFLGWLKTAWNVTMGVIKAVIGVVVNKIKGDFNAIKNAITNRINAIKSIFNTLKGAWLAVLNAIKNIASSIFNGVRNTIKAVVNKIVGILKSLYNKAKDAGKNIVKGLVDGVKSIGTSAVNAVKDVGSGMMNKFKSVLGIQSPSRVFQQFGKYIGQGLIKGLTGTKSQINRKIDDIMSGAIAKVRTRINELRKIRDDFAANIKSNIIQETSIVGGGDEAINKDTIKKRLETQLIQVRTFQKNLSMLVKRGLSSQSVRDIAEAGLEQGGGIAQALSGASATEIKTLNTLQSKINQGAASIGKIAGNRLYNAGIESAKGLLKGILSYRGKIEAALLSLATSMKSSIRKALGIHSPSTVFEEFGKNIIMGLVQGIQSGQGQVNKLFSNMNPQTGGSGSPSSVSTSIYGNISIGSEADANGFMQRLSRNQELAFRSIATRPGAIG